MANAMKPAVLFLVVLCTSETLLGIVNGDMGRSLGPAISWKPRDPSSLVQRRTSCAKVTLSKSSAHTQCSSPFYID